MSMNNSLTVARPDYQHLAQQIKTWGKSLGFQQVGITDIKLTEDEHHLLNWLNNGMHGEMHYMQRHGKKRSRPPELLPGTIRVISVRMDYFPPDAKHPKTVLGNPGLAYISRYAVGRDYHKLIRSRLQQLADNIKVAVGNFNYRAFVDSAPVLEKALSRNAGLGWIGKHTNLIHPKSGSWFFLGELYTDIPLPVDTPFTKNHCGSCQACIDICPTKAIIGPYQLDARRCISYLTIELRGTIPEKFRSMIGNRVFGCDDCQLVCPWNKFAKNTDENDFRTRNGFDAPTLIELFNWSEQEFNERTKGSAIRRIGYDCWLRNIAIGLGNAKTSREIVDALTSRKSCVPDMVKEHIDWAITQHQADTC